MNNKTQRLGLAAIAAFYVVVGGLWALDYFPLRGFYSDIQLKETISERVGYGTAYNTPEYQQATARMEAYSLSHAGIIETEKKVGLLGSILLWVTVALGVAGVILVLTRGKTQNSTTSAKPE